MLNKENLHHAYCIEGEKEAVFNELKGFFESELQILTRGNPDFSYLNFETMGIEEGRDLKARQQNRALLGGKKIFVVSADSITREAQNSLLKIFEEPTEGTHFFLILSSSHILIPTLKSRLQIIQFGKKDHSASDEEMKKFAESSKSARLAILKNIIEEKDRQKAIGFLNSLEAYLIAKTELKKLKKEDTKIFDEIIKMRTYLNDKSSSVKMILEHIALILD